MELDLCAGPCLPTSTLGWVVVSVVTALFLAVFSKFVISGIREARRRR